VVAIGDGLSDAELASIRSASEAWMPDTAFILRNSGTANSIAGREMAWGTIGTTTCRIRPLSSGGDAGFEAERQSAVVSDGEWEIVVPFGTDVTVEDCIEVGGVAYQVKAHDGHRSTRADIRAQCVRRD
jgi:hypothetical protein